MPADFAMASSLIEDVVASVIMGGKEPSRLGGDSQSEEGTVFEASGSVKWFDPSKGYGLWYRMRTVPDVLVHVTRLRRGGFQTASERSRMVCEVTVGYLQYGRLHGDPSIAVAPTHACCGRT